MKSLLGLLVLFSLVACQPPSGSGEDAEVGVDALRENGRVLRRAPIVLAGTDITVEDADKNGSQMVQLSGYVKSTYPIVLYRLFRNGALLTEGADPTIFQSQHLVPVGTYEFRMEAVDNRKNVGSDSVNVTVTPAPEATNTAPIVNAGADQQKIDNDFNGVENVTLAGSASDSQNNITSYRVIRNGTQIFSSISVSAFSQTISLPVGTHTILMEATDAGGLKSSDTMIATVRAAPNTAPVVNAGLDVPLTDFDRSGSEPYILKGTASDAENNIRSFRVLLNGVQVATSLTATINVPVGTNTVVMEATDAGGLKGSDTMIITVSTPNSPPVIVVPSNTAPVVNAGADQVKTDSDNSGSESVTLAGAATDAENNIASYRVLLNGAQVATSLTATINVPVGSHTVTMEATDSAGLKGSDTMMITVNAGPVTPPPQPGGTPPVANAGPDINHVNNDLDNDPKLFPSEAGEAPGVETLLISPTATQGSNPLASWLIKNDGVAVAKGTTFPIPAQKFHFIKGTHKITLEVKDSAGLVSTDSAFVVVKPGLDDFAYLGGTHRIPGVLSISAGGQRILIDRDGNGTESLTMAAGVNSVNPIVNYKWTRRGVILAQAPDPKLLTATFDLPVGSNKLGLSVTDSAGNTAFDETVVTVTAPYTEQVASIPTDPLLLQNHLRAIGGNTGTNHWKDLSAFRFRCEPSHLLYDDPIVFPGQPGKAHLHMFFGNTLANGNSNYDSLRRTGNGTCDGGPLNRSAYWMPALLNENNKVVVPDHVTIYYKKLPGTHRIPRGLKMIFGYDHRYPSNKFGGWKCPGTSGNKYSTIGQVSCAAGQQLMAELAAPTCWDGKNLDSPDHRSHISFCAQDGYGACTCPATHPVMIPGFTMLVSWTLMSSTEHLNWRLSSDHVSPHDPASTPLPGGTSFHADWFGAWDDDVMDMWHRGCFDQFKNCSAGDTGTGFQLKENPGFSFGVAPSERLIDPPVKPIP